MDNLIKCYRYDGGNAYTIIKEYSNGLITISGRINKGLGSGITLSLPFSISTYGASCVATAIYTEGHSTSTAVETLVSENSIFLYGSINGNTTGVHAYFNLIAFKK